MFLWIFLFNVSAFNFLHEQRQSCGVCIWRNGENDQIFRQIRTKMYRYKCYAALLGCSLSLYKPWTMSKDIHKFGVFFWLFYIINRNGTVLPCYAFESLLEKCDSTSQIERFVCRCFFRLYFFIKKKCHIEFTQFSAQPIQWNVFQKTCFLFYQSFQSNCCSIFYVLLFSRHHTLTPLTKCTPILFLLCSVPFSFVFPFFLSIFRFVERCFWVHNQLKIQSLKI